MLINLLTQSPEDQNLDKKTILLFYSLKKNVILKLKELKYTFNMEWLETQLTSSALDTAP